MPVDRSPGREARRAISWFMCVLYAVSVTSMFALADRVGVFGGPRTDTSLPYWMAVLIPNALFTAALIFAVRTLLGRSPEREWRFVAWSISFFAAGIGVIVLFGATVGY